MKRTKRRQVSLVLYLTGDTDGQKSSLLAKRVLKNSREQEEAIMGQQLLAADTKTELNTLSFTAIYFKRKKKKKREEEGRKEERRRRENTWTDATTEERNISDQRRKTTWEGP